MTTPAHSTLIRFEEARRGSDQQAASVIADCRCAHCVVASASPRRLPKAGNNGLRPVVRRTFLAATCLAGVGVVSVGPGAEVANARSAPSKSGWDGTRYWFKNNSGEWRWTSHYSIYKARTGSASKQAPPKEAGSTPGIRQGWDGSRYWFKNTKGQWRWTSHYSIYKARTKGHGNDTGTGRGTALAPPRAAGNSRHETAIGYALAQVGKPYVWGGNGPNSFDCSGLVQQAYRRAGIQLPRVAADQYAATTRITSGQLRRGDLIFWSNSGRASGINHVAIYLGGGTYVEAPKPGVNVRTATLRSGYYPTHFGRP
ncbi:C40 family peptidase [Streptomyces sp. NPDC039016]|uniref:C40 family peptidase n=1 Tax=Streptomyces sp. NPDC039016 TaxID=3154330 RepID=UPI0033FA8C80